MSTEIDNILNKDKIEIEHLRLLKAKQSFEAVFMVMIFFSVVITIGDIAFSKNKEKIEEIGKNAQEALVVKPDFDYTITMNGLRSMDGTLSESTGGAVSAGKGLIKVKVESGDNIYTLFKKNNIPYSKENLNKVKKLNNRKNLRTLRIGSEIILPLE